jgi:alkylhydroperoxidase family enzyme
MSSFLAEPDPTDEVRTMYDDDVAGDGYVMNLTRVWAHDPPTHDALAGLLGSCADLAGLSFRDKGVLVSACASTIGDAYCSLAWGHRLAGEVGADVAVGVLTGDDSGLDDRERTLAAWARRVARDPNGATAAEVEALRAVGYDDRQILGLTAYVAVRLAFSTVNDALGAIPDDELRARADPAVRDAVTWGR